MNRNVVIICAGLVVLVQLAVGVYVYAHWSHTKSRALLASPPAHGTRFLCELDPPSAQGSTNLLSEFQETVRKRFAAFDLSIHWEQVSETHVRITIPVRDAPEIENARNLLTHRGVLELRLVHDDNNQILTNGLVPPGYEILLCETKAANGQTSIEKLVVRIRVDPGLTGNLIKSAMVSRDNLGRPEIAFRLNPQATAAFATVTRQNVGRRLAIVFDGKLMTAPRIAAPIEGGNAVISGQFETHEAFALAAVLESPLPAKVTVLEASSF